MKLPTNWITKDKRAIPIKEMTDSHLINTLNYLARTAPKAMEEELFMAFSAAASFDSDSMAAYYADREIASMGEETVEDFLNKQPIWRALEREALRRKLPNIPFQ